MSCRLEYEKKLRAAGLRVTKQRRIILDVLLSMPHHPNALDLFQKTHTIDPSISLSTVYRTMKALEEQGAIRRHAFDGGPARFEEAGRAHHDHLIDIETGEVFEFHSETIEKIQEEIARSLGYELIDHRLELYGRKIARTRE